MTRKSAKVANKTLAQARRCKGAAQGGAEPHRAAELLSGGNPQIAKGYGDASVQAYIAAMPGWMLRTVCGTKLHCAG